MTAAAKTRELAEAVAALPLRLRAAMLAGVRRERILAGAYAHGDGMCPLLAAHRYGVRAGGGQFVDAWDRFCGIRRAKRRDATAHERAVLIGLLEASLFAGRPQETSPDAPAERRRVEVAA